MRTAGVDAPGLETLQAIMKSLKKAPLSRLPSLAFAYVEEIDRVRSSLPPGVWRKQIVPELRNPDNLELWHQDPLTRRAFEKPRGYPGDAVTLDLIYLHPSVHRYISDSSDVGRAIFAASSNSDASRAVRFRREHVSRLIASTLRTKKAPWILDVGCGHVREGELLAEMSGATGESGWRIFGLDSDNDSLRQAASCYDSCLFTPIPCPIEALLYGEVSFYNDFDLVYSMGLYDYLRGSTAQLLTKRLFDFTKPGGELVIANFSSNTVSRGYMEAFMDWWLIYRTQDQLSSLLKLIPDEAILKKRIYRDPTSSEFFLALTKA